MGVLVTVRLLAVSQVLSSHQSLSPRISVKHRSYNETWECHYCSHLVFLVQFYGRDWHVCTRCQRDARVPEKHPILFRHLANAILPAYLQISSYIFPCPWNPHGGQRQNKR